MKILVALLLMSGFVFASDKDKRDRQIKDYCKNLVGKTKDPILHDYCRSKGYDVGGSSKGGNSSSNSSSNSRGRSMRGDKDHGNK